VVLLLDDDDDDDGRALDNVANRSNGDAGAAATTAADGGDVSIEVTGVPPIDRDDAFTNVGTDILPFIATNERIFAMAAENGFMTNGDAVIGDGDDDDDDGVGEVDEDEDEDDCNCCNDCMDFIMDAMAAICGLVIIIVNGLVAGIYGIIANILL
jgi:hypothetical protein